MDSGALTGKDRRGRAQWARTSATEPGQRGRVRYPVLHAAAQRLAERRVGSYGNGGDREGVLDHLAAVVDGLERGGEETETLPPGDSVIRRRLLELLRGEVVESWAAADAAPDAAEMVSLLRSFESLGKQLQPQTGDLGSYLTSPEGLDLIVEIAHDLRSPLTSILFLADPLRKGQSGEVNEIQRRQLGIIYSAAFNLLCMMSDVVELARGAGLTGTALHPFSLREMLESVQEIVQPVAEEKGLAIRLVSPREDSRIGFPVALSRVLLNLTANALRFTESGFVEVAVRDTGPDRVEVSVRDTGPGMNPGKVQQLYQPFRRKHGRQSPNLSGSGLGLAICRKLVHAMGSHLEVESRPGWGTRFRFELSLPVPPAAI